MVNFFAKVVEETQPGKVFTIQTYLTRFGSSSKSSPYLVIVHEPDSSTTIEVSGNAHVSPEISDEECEKMVSLGWAKPQSGKDEDYGDFPNFMKNFRPDTSPLEIGEEILTLLLSVFVMRPYDPIAVGNVEAAEWIDQLGLLERLKATEGNLQRKLFKLPFTRVMRED
jgi:hypothetical protein